MATITGNGSDEFLIGTDENDTITGEGGNDAISGEAGDDLLIGGGFDIIGRECFRWSQIEDPDGPFFGNIDDGDSVPGSVSQDTGDIVVDFTLTGATVQSEFDSDTQVVGGIDGGAFPVDDNSSLFSRTDADGESATYAFDFSEEVANVDFHVNDIDFDSVVTVLAYDADGNQIPVTITLAGTTDLVVTDDGGIEGNENETTGGPSGLSNSEDTSALIEIAGPVSRIEIIHANDGGAGSNINITDIFYDVIDPAPMGDDTLSGGAGDDTLIGGDGVDTLIGGEGMDTLDGGGCDDDIIVGGGDVAYGGSGDDEFIIDMSLTDNTGDIYIAGGEADENGIVDPTNNNYPDAPYVDGDIIDLRHVDLVSFSPDGGTLDQESGTFVYRNDNGDLVTVHYSEIENILLPPVDPDAGEAGPVDGENTGEVMDPGYDDSLGATNGGGDFIDGPDGNDDVVYGNGGDDDIDAGLGNDLVAGGQGNDTIDGNVGDDLLYGGDGSDTINGGEGKDKLMGGSDDDTLTVGSGDIALGGGGDDVFFVDTSNPDDGNPIFVIGGETDEGGTDTTNDNYPGAPNTIGDVLDLRGVNVTSFNPTGGDPASENGTFTYLNDDGEEITVVYSEIENVIVCFTRGTLIRTNRGDVAIEDLRIGDLVETRDNGYQPLRWAGSRKVPAAGKLAPITFRKGVLGNDRDITVSPQHRMLIQGWRSEVLFGEEEVLAAAKHLVNGDSIFADEGGEVEYFHILFDQHEMVMGNGCWSESFHPGEEGFDALSSAAREEIFGLFPELRDDLSIYGDTNRVTLKAREARILADNPDML